MTPRRRGLSLPEVLVAGVVFSGMLVGIVLTLVGYQRAARELMPGRFSSRSLAGALQWMVREASSMTALYAPDQASLERGFAPDLAHPLVFARQGGAGPELVGLAFNRERQCLERLLFPAAVYDSQHLPTQRQSVGDATGILVTLDSSGPSPRLTLRLGAERGLPFQTALILSPEVLR